MASAFSSTIQHSIGNPSHSDQIRKRKKGLQIQKEDANLSLFANDMIVHRKPHRLNQKATWPKKWIWQKQSDTKSIFRNQRHFCIPKIQYWKQKLGKNPICYINKKNKVPRNKLNQGGKRPALRKLHNEERN